MASRPAEWRINRMRFYGDWCGEKNLDKILPDIVKDTKDRMYHIDLRLFGIQGEEYEVDTNPKNIDELEFGAKQYCASYAFDEDLLLNLGQPPTPKGASLPNRMVLLGLYLTCS